MIRLTIKINSKQSKVLVDLNPQQQFTVLSFLQRVINVCGLADVRPQDICLYDGQYMLPHQLPSYCISKEKEYQIETLNEPKVHIEQNGKRSRKSKNQVKVNKSRKLKEQSAQQQQQTPQANKLKRKVGNHHKQRQQSDQSSSLSYYQQDRRKKKKLQSIGSLPKQNDYKKIKQKMEIEIENSKKQLLKQNKKELKQLNIQLHEQFTKQVQAIRRQLINQLNKGKHSQTKEKLHQYQQNQRMINERLKETQANVKNKQTINNKQVINKKPIQFTDNQLRGKKRLLRIQKQQSSSSSQSESNQNIKHQIKQDNTKIYKQNIKKILNDVQKTRQGYKKTLLDANEQKNKGQIDVNIKPDVNQQGVQKKQLLLESDRKINKQVTGNRKKPNFNQIRSLMNPNNVNNQYLKKQQKNINKGQKKVGGEQSKLEKQQVNKVEHLSFKQHQQLRWIPITKELMKKWQQRIQPLQEGSSIIHEFIVQAKNEIRFKVVQLDEQKFIPVSSGWIQGYVQSVKQEGKQHTIQFDAVVKHNRDEQHNHNTQVVKDYKIHFHNMQELQVDKNTLNQVQKQILIKKIQNKGFQQNEQPPSTIRELKKPQSVGTFKIGQEITPDKKGLQQKQRQKKVQSLQQFICGQINYYFGDKNYKTDLFMQMHANSDPQKYIKLRLMLNFPKIKKFINENEEERLWSYLTTDEKYQTRNYQLDYARKMIRKKGLH